MSHVTSPALEAIDISKRYGERDVLGHVDVTVHPGELHALLGPNGAGKTTLMRVVLGLARRDTGAVRLLGRPVDGSSVPVPDGVAGFVEASGFYPYLSGRRNLALLARLDGDSRADGPTVDHALEQGGLMPQGDVRVSAYSAGARQRLGLAAALLRAPRLLLLDEPTSSLDPAGARDVRALARQLAAEGAAVLLSSHDMAEVEELCASVTILDRGRVIFSGTIDDLRARAEDAIYELTTTDDAAASIVAASHSTLRVVAGIGDGGLEIAGATEAVDAYVIALGRMGIAVRRLERRARSLQDIFLQLTGTA